VVLILCTAADQQAKTNPIEDQRRATMLQKDESRMLLNENGTVSYTHAHRAMSFSL